METHDNSSNIKDRVKTLIRLFLRFKISNSVESIRDDEFEDMWESKPIFAWHHFYEENDRLFKFVSWPEHISSNALVDRKCIKMRENLFYLYLFIQSFAEKSMSEISKETDELLPNIIIKVEEQSEIDDIEESEEEIITIEPRHRVHTKDVLESQFGDDEDIIFDGWTWNTVLRSWMLRDIVASTELYKGLVDMISKICCVNYNYTLNIVVNVLKELRRLYYKALSSSAPEEFDIIRK